MGIKIEVFKRTFLNGTFGTDLDGPVLKTLDFKYELHKDGKCFAAGMETIEEVIDEISGTFNRRCDGDEVVVSSPESKDERLQALNLYERHEFALKAPLLSYEESFLPN